MKKSLKETLVLVGLVPLSVVGIMLLAGSGIFSFIAGWFLIAVGERIVKSRKAKDAAAAALNVQTENGLSLVEMDVRLAYRDKSDDLRVVN